MPAPNKRVGVSRGVCSRKVLREFESLSPVRTDAAERAKSHACMSFSESQGGNPKGSFCVPPPERQAADRYAQA